MSSGAVKEAIARYAGCPRDELVARLTEVLATDPRCPVTRYLLGCACFERGRPATAVRHMMVAHHAEPDFESAALLVFAGMNLVARRGEPLLPVLLATWEEFRRPEFDRCPRERLLLDAFAEPADGIELVSPLSQRLWRIPIQTLRAQMRQCVASREAGLYSQLMALA